MSVHYLVLYPSDPAWVPPLPETVQAALNGIGFLGAECAPGEFLTGAEYLSLVSYLGCSPQILLGEAEAATRIHIREHTTLPKLNAGANLKLPRCLHCRQTMSVETATTLAHCPHCGQSMHPDWRRSAARARMYIEISNIYDNEAVPGESLLECLHAATNVAWDYCFIRRES